MSGYRKSLRAAAVGADALWLAFIFSRSMRSAAASSAESGRFTLLFEALFGGLPDPGLLEHLVRKLAHFTEFFILGVLTVLAVRAFGRALRPLLAHLALGGLTAALCDETLQLFQAGRSAQITDVWLDWGGYLCGALAAAGILALALCTAGRKAEKKLL